MRMSIPKLKAILRYFGTHTDQRFLGKTKLMKLFYFLDFAHVKKYATPVTYDQYVNLEHGPIPSTILNLINEAIEDVDHSLLSDAVIFEKVKGLDMFRLKPTKNFSEKDEKYFSTSEREILRCVCNRFGNKNTKFIEDASHKEAPWKETNLLDSIPYTLAAQDEDCLVSKEEIEMALSL